MKPPIIVLMVMVIIAILADLQLIKQRRELQVKSTRFVSFQPQTSSAR